MRLSGLYVKLFAGFWLVLISTTVLLFWWFRVEGSALQPAEPGQSKHLQRLADYLTHRPLPPSGEALQHGRMAKHGAILYLFDQRGGALQETPPPPELASFVAATLKQPQPMRQAKAGSVWVGPMPLYRSEQTVFAYLKLPLPPERFALGHIWRKSPLVFLVGFLFLSGVVMVALGWHLSRPLHRLEQASKALAEGDLSQRIGNRITQRHDEIGALARRFNQMANAISVSFESQRRLLSDVSHELRSPLTRLQLAASLAIRQQGSESNLQRIQLEANRLEEMIASLLDLSRGQLQSKQRGLLLLHQVAEECVENARYEAEPMHKQVLVRELQPVTVMGHREQLASAIANLLGNALRHADGKVWLSLYESEPGWVELAVEDDGKGVPEDQLEAIFRPFYRVPESRSREDGGAGLGLAIVASAVAAHGGRAFAQNRSSGGLKVVFQLPREN